MSEPFRYNSIETAGPVWTEGERALAAWMGGAGYKVCRGLSIYHSVLSTHIIPGADADVEHAGGPICLDYVVCKGDKVVLVAMCGEDSAPDHQEGQRRFCRAMKLPSMLLPDPEDVMFGEGESMTGFLEGFLGEQLAQGLEGRAEYRVRGLPDGCSQALGEANMIVRQGGTAYITQYAGELGLSFGMRQHRKGYGHRELWVCAESGCARLRELLSGPRPEEARQDVLPLTTRLERLGRGESSDPGCMVERVRRFGGVEIGAWMREYPEELRELERAGIRPGCSYCQAAETIRRLLMDADTEALGRKLTIGISRPHRPANLPPRQGESPPCARGMGPVPLGERLAALRTGRPNAILYGETITSVMEGAARLTGLDYLRWLNRRIQKDWNIGPTYGYGWGIDFAWNQVMDCEKHPDGANAEFKDEYFKKLYQLVIEPFALMERRKNHKHNDKKENDRP